LSALYVAGRFDEREQMASYHWQLEARGHHLTANWTTHAPVKPYDQHADQTRAYASEDFEGVLKADVFILISSALAGGTGVHAELGAAIASHRLQGRPRVMVVGPHFQQSAMYFHPTVERVASFAGALDCLR
jgi:hypothetical protein